MNRPQSFIFGDLYSSSNVKFLTLIHLYGLLNVKAAWCKCLKRHFVFNFVYSQLIIYEAQANKLF